MGMEKATAQDLIFNQHDFIYIYIFDSSFDLACSHCIRHDSVSSESSSSHRLHPRMFCACDAKTVMPSYKLTYFDIRGLAENARIIFAAAKVPYEDVRLSFSFGVPGDFSTIKRPEFDDMKAKGLLDVSLGKVPLLEVDGAQIGQSKAIERFLATQFGMMGSTPVEAGQVDQLCETVRDIKDAYQKVRRPCSSKMSFRTREPVMNFQA